MSAKSLKVTCVTCPSYVSYEVLKICDAYSIDKTIVGQYFVDTDRTPTITYEMSCDKKNYKKFCEALNCLKKNTGYSIIVERKENSDEVS